MRAAGTYIPNKKPDHRPSRHPRCFQDCSDPPLLCRVTTITDSLSLRLQTSLPGVGVALMGINTRTGDTAMAKSTVPSTASHSSKGIDKARIFTLFFLPLT